LPKLELGPVRNNINLTVKIYFLRQKINHFATLKGLVAGFIDGRELTFEDLE